MPPAKKLRVATAADVPSKPLSVAQAAATGDQYALLVAMRERVASTVADPDCPPRDLAALTRRLQEIARELASIDERRKQEAQEGEDAPTGDTAWNAASV